MGAASKASGADIDMRMPVPANRYDAPISRNVQRVGVKPDEPDESECGVLR